MSTTVTIYANDDAYVDSDNADTNYNGEHAYINYIPGSVWKFAFFKFLRPADCAAATSCTLHLPIQTVSNLPDGISLYAARMSNNWNESTLTYNLYDSDVDWYDVSYVYFDVTGAATVAIDVTEQFNKYLGDYSVAIDTNDSQTSVDQYVDLETGHAAYITLTYEPNSSIGPKKYPVADTYLDYSNPDTNFGAATILYLRTLFRFNIRDVRMLESMPTKATLNLYITENTISEPFTLQIGRHNDTYWGSAWEEYTVTANNNNGQPASPYIYPVIDVGQTGWVEIDVTSVFLAQHEWDSVYYYQSLDLWSFILSGYSFWGTGSFSFASRESDHRPYLYITGNWPLITSGSQTYETESDIRVESVKIMATASLRVPNGNVRCEAYMDNYYHGDGTDTKMLLPSGVGAYQIQENYSLVNTAMYLAFDLTGIEYVSSCKLHLYLIDYYNDFANPHKVTLRISETGSYPTDWNDSTYMTDGMGLPDKSSPTWVDLPTTAKQGYVEVDITSVIRESVAWGRGQDVRLKICSWQPFPSDNTFFMFGTHEGHQPAWLEIDDSPVIFPLVQVHSDAGAEIDGFNPDARYTQYSYFEIQYVSEYSQDLDPHTHAHDCYVHFKLNDFGHGIRTALLTFYVLEFSNLNGAASYNLYIDALVASFDENVVDYDNRPSGTVVGTLTVPLSPIGDTPTEYTIDITEQLHTWMGYDGLLLHFRGDPAASPNTGSVFIGTRLAVHSPVLTFTTYEPLESTPDNSVDEYNQTAIIRANYDSRAHMPWATGHEIYEYVPDGTLFDVYMQFDLSVLPRAAYSYLTKAVLKFTRFPTEYTVEESAFWEVYAFNIGATSSLSAFEEDCLVSPAKTVCIYELDVTTLLKNRAYSAFTVGEKMITLWLTDDYYNNHRADWLTIDTSLPEHIGTAETNMTPYLELEWDFSGIGYYVDGLNGDDANDGITYQTPWRTLTKAAQEALTRSTIYLLNRCSFIDEPIGNQIGPVNNYVKWSQYGDVYEIWNTCLININEPGTIERLIEQDAFSYGIYEYDTSSGFGIDESYVHYPLRMWFELRDVELPVQHAEVRLWISGVYRVMDLWTNYADVKETKIICRGLLNASGEDSTSIPATVTDLYEVQMSPSMNGSDEEHYYDYDTNYWLTIDVTDIINIDNNTADPKWFGVELDMYYPPDVLRGAIKFQSPMTSQCDNTYMTNLRPKLVIVP